MIGMRGRHLLGQHDESPPNALKLLLPHERADAQQDDPLRCFFIAFVPMAMAFS